MTKNVQTIARLHLSHMLAKICSKFSKPGFNNTCTMNFGTFKMDLEKAEEPEIKLPTFLWIIEKAKEFQKNICFIDYTKAFDCVDHNKLWKIIQRWEYQTTLPASWEICMWVKKQQLAQDMEQQTSSKSGKEYIKAVYCHPAYLTYMQSTSWEMLGWMKHKMESRLPGEISIISHMQMTPPLWHKVKNNERVSWRKLKRTVKKLD